MIGLLVLEGLVADSPSLEPVLPVASPAAPESAPAGGLVRGLLP